MSDVVPFSLKDSPALIERLLPVQKLSDVWDNDDDNVYAELLNA